MSKKGSREIGVGLHGNCYFTKKPDYSNHYITMEIITVTINQHDLTSKN